MMVAEAEKQCQISKEWQVQKFSVLYAEQDLSMLENFATPW